MTPEKHLVSCAGRKISRSALLSVLAAFMCFLASNLALSADVSAWEIPAGEWKEPAVRLGWKAAEKGAGPAGGLALDNGSVVIVARPGMDGARLYAGKARLELRARLAIAGPGEWTEAPITETRLIESDAGDLALSLAMGPARARISMSAGSPLVSVSPDTSASWIETRTDARYALLPDFFGDDTIFDPARYAGNTLAVPAENMLLHLAQEGRSIVMCMWQGNLTGRDDEAKTGGSGAQDRVEDPQVILTLEGAGTARRTSGSRVEFLGKSVHVGILEGEGLWHDENISLWPAYRPGAPSWKPPFEARWRADFIVAAGKSMSNWRTSQQSFDFLKASEKEEGPPQRWQESLKDRFSYPAYFRDGKAFLCPYADKRERKKAREQTELARQADKTAPEVLPANVYERALIYPLERRDGTPLVVFTPVDLMRHALGRGPCEYVLDLEGLKPRPSGGTRKLLAGATCPLWDNYVAPIAQKIGQLKTGEKLDEPTKTHLVQALEDMWVFVHAIADRIREYQAWAAETAELARNRAALHPEIKPAADKVLGQLDALIAEMDQVKFEGDGTEGHWKARIAEIIEQVGNDDYREVKSVASIRGVGGFQDGKVSRCRQYVKAVRQEAMLTDAADLNVREFSTLIRDRCQMIMRRKHGKEGI